MDKKKILIVEDDVFIRDIYQVKFTQDGFDAIAVEDGLKALKKLEEVTPDMILLDITMPLMDGMSVLKKIKENEQWRDIPILMLTNISEREKVNEALELGVKDYLIKSHFAPSEVVEKVSALLNKQDLV